MKRNLSLDIIKIIACILVLDLHIIGVGVSFGNSMLYYLGVVAIPLFFMVNGNLILNKKNINSSYYLKKIFKIVMIVFCWNVLLTILFIIKSNNFINPFIQTFNNCFQKGNMNHFWFLFALIVIYFIMIFINKKVESTSFLKKVTAFCIVIALGVDLTSIIRSLLGYSIVQIHFVQTFRLWTWFAYFFLGGLYGRKEFFNKIIKKVSLKANLVAIIILTLVMINYEYFVSYNLYNTFGGAEYFYDNFICFILASSIFVFAYRCDNYNEKISNIINHITPYIMGIYILHWPLITLVIRKSYGFYDGFINLLLIPTIFIVCYIASYIISKIKFVKNLIKL